MKQLRIVFAAAIMAFAAFGFAAAQDATSTPLPEATAAPEATTAPETTAVPETETTDAAPSPFMGIQFEAADHGVQVVAVAAGSPAEAAGIQEGDVVNAINGIEVSEDNVRETVQGFAVGDTVTVDVTRDEESLSLDVTLAEAPADMLPGRDNPMPRLERFEIERPRLGLGIADNENGVLVTEVEVGSPAEAAGVLVDDVVTAINGEIVATPQEAAEAVGQAIANAVPGEFDVTISVTRGEESLDLVATLVKPEMPTIPDMPGFGGRGRDDRGFGFGPGMGGFNLIPREGEEGAFDLVVPFRPADPAAVTDEVTAALADLGIRIVPREGEDGLFDLYVPAETLGEEEGGFMLPHLQMFGGMLPEGFEFHFGGPMGRGFNFEIPDLLTPTEPAPAGEGSL